MSELEPERLRPLLSCAFGEPYLYLAETTSTQDVLRDGDFPHGTVCVTEHQTAGRGRSDRTWNDVPSTALLCSVVLRPPAGAALPQLSLIAGLGVAAALEYEIGAPVLLKWPNDVLVDGRKVAGILLEASAGVVVCGIGVNVNQEKGDLPPETRTPATSLRIVTGRPLDRGSLLATLLMELERRYAAWLESGLEGLTDELEGRNAARGRRVRVAGRAGTAGAIAPDGRLTIALDGGDSVLVESGEVELWPETRERG